MSVADAVEANNGSVESSYVWSPQDTATKRLIYLCLFFFEKGTCSKTVFDSVQKVNESRPKNITRPSFYWATVPESDFGFSRKPRLKASDERNRVIFSRAGWQRSSHCKSRVQDVDSNHLKHTFFSKRHT